MVMGEQASASTSPILELRGIPIVVGRHWPRRPCIRANSFGGGSASRVSRVEPARARGDISLEVSTRTFLAADPGLAHLDLHQPIGIDP
jgi:hypothetical protein